MNKYFDELVIFYELLNKISHSLKNILPKNLKAKSNKKSWKLGTFYETSRGKSSIWHRLLNNMFILVNKNHILNNYFFLNNFYSYIRVLQKKHVRRCKSNNGN